MKGVQRKEVDGVMEEKEVDVTLRFDLTVPMGAPYAAIHEAIKEFDEEVVRMEEASKRQAEEMAAFEEAGDAEDIEN